MRWGGGGMEEGKEGRGLCPLDPHQRPSLWNPLLKGIGEEGANGVVADALVGPLLTNPLKVRGSKGPALGGVQGQRPWPSFPSPSNHPPGGIG